MQDMNSVLHPKSENTKTRNCEKKINQYWLSKLQNAQKIALIWDYITKMEKKVRFVKYNTIVSKCKNCPIKKKLLQLTLLFISW